MELDWSLARRGMMSVWWQWSGNPMEKDGTHRNLENPGINVSQWTIVQDQGELRGSVIATASAMPLQELGKGCHSGLGLK